MSDLVVYREINNKLSKIKELTKKKDFEDLRSIGFSLLIPTFDYECAYSHLMYGNLGKETERLRKYQKKLDKKGIKTVFQTYNQLSESDKNIYMMAATDTATFFVEKYFDKIRTKSFTLGTIKDERVADNLAKYKLGSNDREEANSAAKQLVIDIVKERVLFDLLATYGDDLSYEISLNSLNDVRIQDALATYGLMQIQSSLVGNAIIIRLSLREYVEDLMNKQDYRRARLNANNEGN